MSNINIRDLKALKVGSVDCHEFELGSDKVYSSGVRQTPRPNNEPVFRDNGYQLDFTVATGGNINFNGIDYPQSTLITSFEAEGKTWLLNKFSSNTIESETGDLATVSVNEGDSFLDSDVWQKKPFALEISRANSEAILFDNSEVITDLFDMDMSFSFINNSFGNNRIILQAGSFNNASTAYFAIQQVSTGVRFLLKKPSNVALINETLVVGVGEVVNITLKDGVLTMNGNTTSYADTPLNLVSDFSGGLTIGRLTGFASANMTITGFTWQGNKYYLTEGLGNEINNGSTKGTIETSHVDGMRRRNYGMWLKGNDVDGWTAYD